MTIEIVRSGAVTPVNPEVPEESTEQQRDESRWSGFIDPSQHPFGFNAIELGEVPCLTAHIRARQPSLARG